MMVCRHGFERTTSNSQLKFCKFTTQYFAYRCMYMCVCVQKTSWVSVCVAVSSVFALTLNYLPELQLLFLPVDNMHKCAIYRFWLGPIVVAVQSFWWICSFSSFIMWRDWSTLTILRLQLQGRIKNKCL